jgi:hypothetical protein
MAVADPLGNDPQEWEEVAMTRYDLKLSVDGNEKIIDLLAFRRERSIDNWVLALWALGFCVFTGLFAAKISPLLGAGGLNALVEWIR